MSYIVYKVPKEHSNSKSSAHYGCNVLIAKNTKHSYYSNWEKIRDATADEQKKCIKKNLKNLEYQSEILRKQLFKLNNLLKR